MIYLDNAATTRMSRNVLEAMMPWMTENYGNASSLYELGNKSRKAVSDARRQVASLIGARPEEIFFTAGGSEADNWAIKGVAEAFAGKGKHIITSKVEHHAVLKSCEYLENRGYEVTYLDVDEYGRFSPSELEKAIRPDTILISLMTANNEVGTIEPVTLAAEIAHKHDILFHTDAVQAYGQVPMNVKEMNVDLLSASAHKLHGPKGIGMLYIRRGIRMPSFIHGGGQERDRRAGTENVPGIVGFGAAAAAAGATMDERVMQEIRLRDHLIERVMTEIPYTRLNGHPEKRLPGNTSFCFRFVSGESLLIMLDMEGICASGGSACSAGSLEPSHVLLACGCNPELASGSVRLTIGDETTMEEVDRTVDVLKETVARLREMSPEYKQFRRDMGV